MQQVQEAKQSSRSNRLKSRMLLDEEEASKAEEKPACDGA